MSSDSDSDCVITDYKEGDSCIIVTGIPAKLCKLEPEETPNRIKIPGDGHCIANCFAVHFKENLDKVLDKLDTEFRSNLEEYRKYSELSTEQILKEVYNYVTLKRYNNDTADMFLSAFANIYQTKVVITHAGSNTRYSVGDRYNEAINLYKVKDHYDLLLMDKGQEIITTNMDDHQTVEDEISQNLNLIKEW